MNRPEKLNAVNHELRASVSEALIRADGDESIHVVILRSNGRSFCVGYDIDNDTPERAARPSLASGHCAGAMALWP